MGVLRNILRVKARVFFADLPSSTYILSLAQAINLTCAVVSVTVAAIVGLDLAPSPALATLPYGFQALFVMVMTYPASYLMGIYGRRVMFSLASLLLMVSGVIGYLALESGSFVLLNVSHGFLGSFVAFANFYRFAAVDNVADRVKARVISLVVAGGLLAALLGPLLANFLRVVSGFEDFSLVYGSLSILGLLTLFLMRLWRPVSVVGGGVSERIDSESAAGSLVISGRRILVPVVAIFCGTSGYMLMNLLMIQSSLTMHGYYSFGMNSHAIQMHVMAMFVPTLFAGHVISRFGVLRSLSFGFLMLLCAGVTSQFGIEYHFIYVSLIFLGLGWCFTYVGGSALLAASVGVRYRYRWQGVNEFSIAFGSFLGSVLPAPLLGLLGWELSNLLVLPFSFVGLFLLYVVWRGGFGRVFLA